MIGILGGEMKRITSAPAYQPRAAVGDIVELRDCGNQGELARVVRLFPWGLRVTDGVKMFDCERFRPRWFVRND